MKHYPTNLRLVLAALFAVCLGMSAWAGLKAFTNTFSANAPAEPAPVAAQVAAPAKVKAAAPSVDYTANGNYRLFWQEDDATKVSDDFALNNDNVWGFYRYDVATGSYEKFANFDGNSVKAKAENGDTWYTNDEYCFVSVTGNSHASTSASPAIVFTAPADGIYYATFTARRNSPNNYVLFLRSRLLEPTGMQCDKTESMFVKPYGVTTVDNADGKQPQTLDFFVRLSAGQRITFEEDAYSRGHDDSGRTFITDLSVASVDDQGQPFSLEQAQAYPRFYDAAAVAPTVDLDAASSYHLFKANPTAGIGTADVNVFKNNDEAPWGFLRRDRSAGTYTPFTTFDANNGNVKGDDKTAWYTNVEYCFVSVEGNTHPTNSASPVISFTAPATGIYYGTMTVWRDKEKQYDNGLVMRSCYLGPNLVDVGEKAYGMVSDGANGQKPETLDFFIRVKQGDSFTFEIGDSQSAGRTHITDLGVATCHADGSPFTLEEAKAYPRFYDAVGEEEEAGVALPATLTFPGYNDAKVASYTAEWTATVDGAVWTLNGFNNNNNGWAFVRCGRKSNDHTATLLTPAVKEATEMIVTVDKTSNISEVTIQAQDAENTYTAMDITSDWKQGEVSIDLTTLDGYSNSALQYLLTIESTAASGNGTTQISKVVLQGASTEPSQPTFQFTSTDVNISREAGQGSTPQTENYDFTEAKQFLGVDELKAYMFDIIKPDNVVELDYAQYGGWFDANGNPTTEADLGDNPGVCVKFNDALNGGAYTISDKNCEAGQTINLKWELQSNMKAYHFNFHITFTAPIPTYTSCDAANRAATTTDQRVRLTVTDALVTYVNGKNTYIQDATGGFLIYSEEKFNAGEKFSGTFVGGTLCLHKGTPELKDVEIRENLSVTSRQNPVEPIEVDAAELAREPIKYVSQYVKVKPAKFAADVLSSKSANFTVGETSLILYDQFAVAPTFNKEADFTVAGLVTIYKTNTSTNTELYPTKADDVAEYVVPTDPDGTDLAAENAAAVASVTEGNYYRIFTEDATGAKYYMTSTGYLTADEAEAVLVPMNLVRREGDNAINIGDDRLDVTAFKFNKFTNPDTNNDPTGAIVPQGHIMTNVQNRDDYDAQVFFLGAVSGKYAVRCTATYNVKNGVSGRWSAHAYWTTTDTNNDGLPEAEYGLTADYRWQLEDVTELATINPRAQYTVKNADAELYMSFNTADNRTVLSAEPVALSFEKASDKTWYITDGVSYVGLDGTYNMSAKASGKTAITVAPVAIVDGALQVSLHETNGYIGCDNLEAGKKCYSNKKTSEHGYWILTMVDPHDGLAAAIQTAQAAADVQTGALFQKTAEAKDALQQAIREATTALNDNNATANDIFDAVDALKQAMAAFSASIPVAPEADKAYTVQLNDPTAVMYMNITEGPWVKAEPTQFVFEAAEEAGKYYMKDANADLYLAMNPSREGDTWSMGNDPAKKVAVAIENVNGLCHIQTPSGYIGIDVQQDNSIKFYADKAKGQSTWLIAPVQQPEPQPEPGDELTATWVANAQNYANAADLTTANIGDNVTATFAKGTNNNSPKYYTTGEAARLYGGNTLTLTAAEGTTITGVTFTFGSGDGTNEITANPGEFANGAWTGSANEVVFTIGGTSGHRRIAAITVTYTTDGGTVTPDPEPEPQPAVVTYAKVTSADQLEADVTYLMVNEEAAVALGATENFGATVPVTINGDVIAITDQPVDVLTLTGTANGWTFASSLADGFLSWTSGNSLNIAESESDNTKWTISFDEQGNATIANVATPARILSYNAGSPRFAAYGNMNQKRVQLYKSTAGAHGPEFVFTSTDDPTFSVAGNRDITNDDNTSNVINVDGDEIANGIVVAYDNVVTENEEAYLTGFRATATVQDSKGNVYTVKTRSNEDNVLHVAEGLFGPNEQYEVSIQPIIYYNYNQFCDGIYDLWQEGLKLENKDVEPYASLGVWEADENDPQSFHVNKEKWNLRVAAQMWSQALKDNNTIPYIGDAFIFEDCDPMPYYVDNTAHTFVIKTGPNVVTNVKALMAQDFKAVDAWGNDFTAEFLSAHAGDVATGINSLNGTADQTIYNMAGQRVAKAVKGLYIKGGRKVVVK